MSQVHEPTDAARAPLVIGMVITVAAIVVGAVAVFVLLRSGRSELSVLPEQPEWYQHTPIEVNEVEAEPYVRPSDAEREADAAAKRLGSYGWADRDAQTVHVPIDVAIDSYLQTRSTP